MSNPINLQKPLTIGGQGIYPPTTAQQVIMPDGTRLNAAIEKIKDVINEINKAEIVQDVLEALPAAEGVEF
jgi:hypothetical protein